MSDSMKEKAIVSSVTLITSLAGYFYAKGTEKDVTPVVMVSGFIGVLLGEAIAQTFIKDDKNKPNKPK